VRVLSFSAIVMAFFRVHSRPKNMPVLFAASFQGRMHAGRCTHRSASKVPFILDFN
jgi:hypothetical protein